MGSGYEAPETKSTTRETKAPLTADERGGFEPGLFSNMDLNADLFGDGGKGTLELGDEEEGPAFSLSDGEASVTQEHKGQGGKYQTETSGSLQRDSASLSRDYSIKTEQQGVTTKGNLMPTGKVGIHVEPCPGDDTHAMVVATIEFGLEGGFGLGGKATNAELKEGAETVEAAAGEASVGVSFKAEGTVSVTVRHRVKKSEAGRLAADLQAPGTDVLATLREAGQLAKMAACAPEALAITGGAAALDMPVGDGVEFSLGGKIGGSIDAEVEDGVDGAGISGGYSKGAKRTLKISRSKNDVGDDIVTLTVAFEDSTEKSAGFNLKTLGSGSSFESESTLEDKNSATFALNASDENFDEYYEAIVTAPTAAMLEPLKKVVPCEASSEHTEGSAREVAAQLFGFGMSVGAGDSKTTSVEQKGDDVWLNYDAESFEDYAINFLGREMLGSKSGDELDSTVTKEGGEATLTETDSSRSIVPEALEAFMPSYAKNQSLGLEMNLTHGDLERLGARAAASPGAWCNVPDDVGLEKTQAWIAFGKSLASPIPEPTAVQAGFGETAARRAARFAALADWVSAAGGDAASTIERASGALWDQLIRQVTTDPEALAAGAGPIANGVVIPGVSEELHKRWDKVDDEWKTYPPMVSAVDGYKSAGLAGRKLDVAEITMTEVEASIHTSAAEFAEHGEASHDMLVTIEERRILIREWRAEIAERARAGEIGDEVGPYECDADPALALAPMIAALRGHKAMESALFAALDSTRGVLGTDEIRRAQIGEQFQTLYYAWIESIESLRSNYVAAGIDSSEWQVSAPPPSLTPRHAGTEPDPYRFRREFPDTHKPTHSKLESY